MKKILLLVIFALSFHISFADGNDDEGNGEIVFSEDYQNTELKKCEIPVFHAEINANNTILVQVDRPTDFEVKILDANGMNVRYRGVTIDDVLHITAQGFSIGCYILRIETDVCTYTGEFEISNAL